MNCYKCGGRTSVTDSRKGEGYIRRRRLCACGEKFTTIEVAIGAPLPDGKLVEELKSAIGEETREGVKQNILEYFGVKEVMRDDHETQET